MKEKKIELIVQLTANAIAVQVPESAKSFDVWEATMSLRGRKKGDNVLGFDGDRVATIDLPPGSWSILGRPEEMKVSDWNKIIEEKDRGISVIAAGSYLLKSKSIEDKSVIILIKQ